MLLCPLPLVRRSNQYKLAAGSTCSPQWTGSSGHLSPLNITFVQQPAGKTTQPHPITKTHKLKGGEFFYRAGFTPNANPLPARPVTRAAFLSRLLRTTAGGAAPVPTGRRGRVTAESRKPKYNTSDLLSAFVARGVVLTSCFTQWWHSSSNSLENRWDTSIKTLFIPGEILPRREEQWSDFKARLKIANNQLCMKAGWHGGCVISQQSQKLKSRRQGSPAPSQGRQRGIGGVGQGRDALRNVQIPEIQADGADKSPVLTIKTKLFS